MPNVPNSIAIILDGNRRWAKEKGLPSFEGHRAGYEKVKEVSRWVRAAGIKEMTVYAFSIENWNRAKDEVEYLMKLLEGAFTDWLKEIEEEGMRIRFIGERSRVSPRIVSRMEDMEARTKDAPNGTLAIAISYGGRAEILDAVNTLLAEGREQISEEDLRNAMWSKGLADPDLIIRTSGEQRLSGFLTWESVYSELFFTKTFWPAFDKAEFDSILAEYAERDRRHGK